MAYRQINVRSPFYVQLSTTETNVKLELRIWTGDVVTDRPTDSDYLLLKEAVSGKATFEISELVRDRINQNKQFSKVGVWVETEFTELDSGAKQGVPVVYLATEGYTKNTEGIQHNSNTYEENFVMLPEDVNGDHRITTAEGQTSLFSFFHNSTGSSTYLYTINFFNGNSNIIGIPPTTESDEIVTNVEVDSSIESISFDFDKNYITVYNDVFECNKYNTEPDNFLGYVSKTSQNHDLQKPVTLFYINKYGAVNTMQFTLKRTDEVSATSESFVRNNISYSSLTDRGTHSSMKNITSSRRKFVVNTDWLREYYVDQLEELILSEYVWASIPNIKSNSGAVDQHPVIVTDKKILRKNHLNDKLIQYSITFEMSSDHINTLR